MPDPQKVIIVDAQGTRHVFPAGFDPVRAGQIVRQQTAPRPAGLATIGDQVAAKGQDFSRFGPMQGLMRDQAEGGADAAALPAIGATIGAAVSAPLGGVPGAAIGGMAGEAARRNLDLLRGRMAPTTSEDAAKGILKEGALQGGIQAATGVVGAGMKAAAPWIMEKAVKASDSLLKEYGTTGRQIAQTLLNEGVNVTANGAAKLGALLNATNDEIKTLIASAPGTIEKKIVAARVLPTAAKVAQQTNPTRDLKAVGKTVKEFLDHPVYQGDLTIPEAQAMKQGTYRQIGQKYGEISSAEVEAQKALARGLKEEVAAAVPQVSALNKRDSELMAALDATGRQAAIAGRKDPVGFAWAASARPEAFVAALLDRSPAVKSMLARGLWNSASKVTGYSPAVIRAAVVALSSEDEK